MIINGSALLEYAPIKGMVNDKMSQNQPDRPVEAISR